MTVHTFRCLFKRSKNTNKRKGFLQRDRNFDSPLADAVKFPKDLFRINNKNIYKKITSIVNGHMTKF